MSTKPGKANDGFKAKLQALPPPAVGEAHVRLIDNKTITFCTKHQGWGDRTIHLLARVTVLPKVLTANQFLVSHPAPILRQKKRKQAHLKIANALAAVMGEEDEE
jgi:hypothetical protein